MADFKTGLFAFLQAKAGLTALLDSSDSFRLFADEAPQGTTLPYVTYQDEDEDTATHLRGASEYTDTRITFTVHAATSDSRAAVRKALRDALHMQMNQQLDDGTDMRVARLKTVRDSKIAAEDGSETNGIFVCEMDFDIVFFEALPDSGDEDDDMAKAFQNTDLTVNNSTTLQDSDLSIAVTSGQKYAVTLFLRLNSASVASKLNFSAPGGSTGKFSESSGAFGGSEAAVNTPQSAGDAGFPIDLQIDGYLIAGADGYLTLQYAQNVQDASNNSLLTGSWITAVAMT